MTKCVDLSEDPRFTEISITSLIAFFFLFLLINIFITVGFFYLILCVAAFAVSQIFFQGSPRHVLLRFRYTVTTSSTLSPTVPPSVILPDPEEVEGIMRFTGIGDHSSERSLFSSKL